MWSGWYSGSVLSLCFPVCDVIGGSLHPPQKSLKTEIEGPQFISYWRDLEGAQKDTIQEYDLFFLNWPTTRKHEGKT